MTIGDWVRRERKSKWHLVESIIADDPVTRCGRRLRKTRHAIVVFAGPGTPTNNHLTFPCRQCRGT